MIVKDYPMEDALLFLECKHEEDSYHLSFRVWKVSQIISPKPMRFEFHDEASPRSESHDDREKALPFLQGDLKWDGCINYTYPGQEHCMLHGCGLESVERERLAFREIYKAGAELIKSWDGGD